MPGRDGKRPISDIAGGTAESVHAALCSDATASVTDEQLDLVLPCQGYKLLDKPGPTEGQQESLDSVQIQGEQQSKQQSKQHSAHGVIFPGHPQNLSADEVEAFFVHGDGKHFGGFGDRNSDTFLRMQELSIPTLEEIQGFADDVSAGATSREAQMAGLKWSTEISRFIA